MKNRNLEMIKIEPEDMEFIYERYMKQDFPDNELKPLAAMQKMYEKGIYEGYGLIEDNQMRAYWFVVKPENADCCLLDYLAVVKEYRGYGYGSLVLQKMKEAMPDNVCMLIEAEDPKKTEDEAERKVREARLRFYEQNGANLTSVKSEVFKAPYVIFCLSHREIDDKEARQFYLYLYKNGMMSEKTFQKNVKVFSDIQ